MACWRWRGFTVQESHFARDGAGRLIARKALPYHALHRHAVDRGVRREGNHKLVRIGTLAHHVIRLGRAADVEEHLALADRVAMKALVTAHPAPVERHDGAGVVGKAAIGEKVEIRSRG